MVLTWFKFNLLLATKGILSLYPIFKTYWVLQLNEKILKLFVRQILILLLVLRILPDEMGMLYLSPCLLRIGPTLCTLAGVITEGPCVTGVTGAVGVVGVWGKLCGDVSEMFLDIVTLDTRFSWGGPRGGVGKSRDRRKKALTGLTNESGFTSTAVLPLISSKGSSQSQLITGWNCIIRTLIRGCC